MTNKYYLNYYEPRIRELCHAVKERDPDAIKDAANMFLDMDIPLDAILMPAPQHTGQAVYTKEIADIIARETGIEVMDILRCEPRETLYALKKRGISVPNAGIYSLTAIPNGRPVYLIDNVIDIGSTVMSAGQALGINVIPLVIASTEKREFIIQ